MCPSITYSEAPPADLSKDEKGCSEETEFPLPPPPEELLAQNKSSRAPPLPPKPAISRKPKLRLPNNIQMPPQPPPNPKVFIPDPIYAQV